MPGSRQDEGEQEQARAQQHQCDAKELASPAGLIGRLFERSPDGGVALADVR
jgi:hypothetical protein